MKTYACIGAFILIWTWVLSRWSMWRERCRARALLERLREQDVEIELDVCDVEFIDEHLRR